MKFPIEESADIRGIDANLVDDGSDTVIAEWEEKGEHGLAMLLIKFGDGRVVRVA